MKKKRFSIEQIAAMLQQVGGGVPVGGVCRQVGIGVIGAGVQARSHIDAIRQVRAITDVRICDVDAARTQAFVDALRRDHPTGCRFQAVTSAADAVVEADVVVTATTSSTPVFPGSLLKPGAHVNAIGAFQPGHRELDNDLMKRSRIFVDSRAEALAGAGDLIIPLGKCGYGRLTLASSSRYSSRSLGRGLGPQGSLNWIH